MDGLILLSAVLLFALICIAMVGVVPAWPVALLMGLGVAVVFAALYRFLFLFWMGGTPGDWLAGITATHSTRNEIPPMTGRAFVKAGVGPRTSDVRPQTSDLRLRTSRRLQISDLGFQISDLGLQT